MDFQYKFELSASLELEVLSPLLIFNTHLEYVLLSAAVKLQVFACHCIAHMVFILALIERSPTNKLFQSPSDFHVMTTEDHEWCIS